MKRKGGTQNENTRQLLYRKRYDVEENTADVDRVNVMICHTTLLEFNHTT